MSLVWSNDTCEIRCGDGPEGLASLGEPVKLLLTDPPYAVLRTADMPKPKNIKTGHEGHLVRYQEWDDLTDEQYTDLMQRLLAATVSTLDGWALIFGADRWQSELIRWGEAAGLRYRLPYWWGKTNPPPRIRVPQPKAATEQMLLFESHRDWMVDYACLYSYGDVEHAVRGGLNWVYGPFAPSSHRIHRTQKPDWLLQHFITEFTQPGDLVADPFGGSFATLRACLVTGRRCVSWELDERRCEVAAMVHTHGFHRARAKAVEYGFVGHPQESSQPTLFDLEELHV